MSQTPSTHDAAVTDDAGLGHGLKVRHLTMMGLGSAIGAGLFLGTGVGIAKAGPAVLLSYLVAGLVVVMVMRMLGELGSALPTTGSFADYARIGIGNWAGFVVGWLYWYMLIMVLGAEITGASKIMTGWLPSVPQWVIALAIVVVFAAVNLAKVANFGEFEFWFAAIKVAVISAFLVIGVLLIAGWLPGHEAVGMANLTHDGGFMPNGFSGVAAGLLVVAFAFGGIEIVTIAASESVDPKRAIAAAVRSVVWRIGVFYIGSVAVMVTLLPWQGADEGSPFVRVLEMANIRGVAGFMEVVVVVALLSAFNANIYATSRMAFSLAHRGDGPKIMTRISATGVPVPAVLLSVFFGFVSVLLNWWLPDTLLTILLNAVGAALLVVWAFIVIAQLRIRPRLDREGVDAVRMWAFPYLSWATLAALGAFVVLMLWDADARNQIFAVVAAVLILGGLYLVRKRFGAPIEAVEV